MEPFGQVSDWNFCLGEFSSTESLLCRISFGSRYISDAMFGRIFAPFPGGNLRIVVRMDFQVPAYYVSFFHVRLLLETDGDWQIQVTLCLPVSVQKWHERDVFGRKHEAGPAGKGFFFANQLPCSAGLTWKIQNVSLIFVHGRFNLSCQLQTCLDISYLQTWCWIFLFQNTKICKATNIHNVANPPPVYIKINLRHQSILSTKCWPFITC